jgi:hypothetical protein
MISTIRKPHCPTFEQLEQSAEITNALENLGISPTIFRNINRDVIVLNTLIKLWKEFNKKNAVPHIIDLVRVMKIPNSTIKSTLDRLILQGKVMQLGRGIYLPKTQKV